jgi:hypothetical protein
VRVLISREQPSGVPTHSASVLIVLAWPRRPQPHALAAGPNVTRVEEEATSNLQCSLNFLHIVCTHSRQVIDQNCTADSCLRDHSVVRKPSYILSHEPQRGPYLPSRKHSSRQGIGGDRLVNQKSG